MTCTAVSMCQPQPGPANISETIGEKPPNDASIHRLRRPRRVQVDRGVELFGAFQDRPIKIVVQIAAAIVAVNDRAGEFLLAHPALQLGRRLIRSGGRQRGEAAEARWVLLDRAGDEIIGFRGKLDGFRRFRLFEAGRSDRYDLHIDASGIHVRYSLVAEVAKLRDELGRPGVVEFLRLLFQVVAGTVEKSRRCKVFFERDRPHRRRPPGRIIRAIKQWSCPRSSRASTSFFLAF